MLITHSAAAKEFHDFHATGLAQAKALVAKFRPLEGLLQHAANVVSRASTSTPQQKQGQEDWVRGIREGASAVAQIQVEFNDLEAGKTAAAKVAVAKVERLYNAGNALVDKGDKLLGLSNSD